MNRPSKDLPFLPSSSGVVPAQAHPVYHLQALEQTLQARGLNVDVQADGSVRERGYWAIKVGTRIFRQVNTPAALALLDGVLAGADEQLRVTALKLGGA